MLSITLIIIILLITMCEVFAVSCVKIFHNNNNIIFMIIAVIMYSIVCYLLHKSMDYSDSIGIINVIWSALSIVAITLVGLTLFKEKIHTHDIFAMICITIGILILKYTN